MEEVGPTMRTLLALMVAAVMATPIVAAEAEKKEITCIGDKLEPQKACKGMKLRMGIANYVGATARTNQKNKDGSTTFGFLLNRGETACWITVSAKGDILQQIIFDGMPEQK